MNQASMHTGISNLSSMHQMMEGAVGVFWDHQSCPHPQGYTGNTVIRRIRALALTSGSIKQFNVYVNPEPYSKDTQGAAGFADKVLRKELHASGVSVLACPAISGESVAANMIIVDILAFALQSHLPTTLVVISTDLDLAYGISVLRQRRFKVILITSSSMPTDTAMTLRFQSEVSFTWEDVLDGERRAPADENVALSLAASPASRSQRSLRTTSEDRLVAPITSTSDPIMHDPATSDPEAVTALPEPSEQAPSSLRPPKLASCSALTGTIPNFRQTSGIIIPEDVREVIDLLVKGAHPQRGLPREAIQNRVAFSPKMAWKETKTVAHLEEGVRLGLLTHTVRPQTRTRSECQYYAVAAGIKANWVQGVRAPAESLRAETNPTNDTQKHISGGPASPSTHRIQGERSSRASRRSLKISSANQPPTSKPKHITEGSSFTRRRASAKSGRDTSRSNLNVSTSAGSRNMIANAPKTAIVDTTPARINNPGISAVPDHLRDIIDVLVLAGKPRGWPQESIEYYLHRRDIERWKDSEKVLAALEESVRLGLLFRSVCISRKNKNAKTYYAVEVGLKTRWTPRFQRV